jgi:hypothetical protein
MGFRLSCMRFVNMIITTNPSLDNRIAGTNPPCSAHPVVRVYAVENETIAPTLHVDACCLAVRPTRVKGFSQPYISRTRILHRD